MPTIAASPTGCCAGGDAPINGATTARWLPRLRCWTVRAFRVAAPSCLGTCPNAGRWRPTSRARLREECGPDQPQPTLVMDAGIATEANLAWLREQGYGWICVNRGKCPAPLRGGPDFDIVAASRQTLVAWSLGAEDGKRRLYVRSEARKQKEDELLSAKRARLEAELASLLEGLAVPGGAKKNERVRERVGRIRDRYARISGQYDVHVDRDPGTDRKGPGPNAKAVRFSSRPHRTKPTLAQTQAPTRCALSASTKTRRTTWNRTCTSREWWPCSAPRRENSA